ncbi:MAG: glycoside hydrolase family 3 C-terminal domain-containing protein [Clostridia bacterium]|nr:glycoside hydrolase family 3 C-terminal domain-containing protein [Clostridia bacterium]
MKKGMSTKKALAVFTPCISAVVAIMLALIIAVSMFAEDISLFLYGRAQMASAAALADGYDLCEDIVEEGTVLLKNEKDNKGNPALPLSEEEIKQVNVFGWAAYDWMTMAFGSGYANTNLPRTKLFPALEQAGIKYNQDLYNLYKSYYTAHNKTYGDGDYLEYRGGVAFGSEEIFVLREPSKAQYEALTNSIISFSSVGIVVIGRTGSESKDLELQQVKQTTSGSNAKKTVTDRHYLQLSTEEEDMIEVAKATCEKVIVVLNTANTMETGFLDDEGIDGALLVGITGLSGVNGLVNVLRGYTDEPVPVRDEKGNPKYNEDGTAIYEKNSDGTIKTERVSVSPSGRTADTYAYDILGTTPAAVNQGNKGNGEKGAGTIYSNRTGAASQYRAYVDYSEGIYVGYKWFETADVEGYWEGKGGYESVVQYPFGYGLSYTDFTWTITKVLVNGKEKTSGELAQNDKIEIYVEVKNTGDYAGSDVVELYYTAPYYKGGIEKAHVNLAAFAKTGLIQPGGMDLVKLELNVQSMASYDCYDANKNGHTGYELDEGDYQLRLMKNSHEEGNMSDVAFNGAAAAHKNAVLTYSIRETNYDKDAKTNNDVENRFTNKDGKGNDQTIDQSDLDGSQEETPVTYLSRADFAGTYPKKIVTARKMTDTALSVSQQNTPTDKQLEYAGYLGAKRKTSSNGLKLEDVLGTETYDDEIWAELIANITDIELYRLVSDGYFKTKELPSIGKQQYIDLDGPLGFNTRVTGGNGTTCEFMAYPSGTMLAQTWNTDLAYAMGLSVGRERSSMEGLRGWYAPGANTHRNPFGGRNGEYYSEDGVLAGYICAGTVSGAKDMGVYSYVKHFVVNDSEYSREGLFTFLTEQTLREVYLKPFEIMIKEGGGNALMTSMNRLGRVWSGANYGLMTEIVRDEWGFRGTAVTDWVNSNDTYMPAYRGIWAGNDIWLSNGISDSLFGTIKNDVGYKIAENVAHDVLWTLVDTINAETAFDPNAAGSIDLSAGASYNYSWVWYVVLVEVVLAAGVGVMAFFLVRTIQRNKKATDADASAKE